GDEYRGVVKVKVGPITAQYRGNARFVELDKDKHRAVLRAEGRDVRGQGNASATVVAELNDVGGGSTKVTIATDLSVTGKVAQFGRGVLADVSAKLLGQFVERLESDVLSGNGGGGAAGSPAGKVPPALQPEPVARPELTAEEVREGALTVDAPRADPSSAARASGAVDTRVGTKSGDQESPNGAEGRSQVRMIESRPAEPVDLLDVAGGSVAKRVVPVGIGVLLLLVLWRGRRARRRRRARRS
ncbi:MAG TPA: SRPBCC family protein, partial [Acidimicrobiales bacterium]|nr:SRPBCC family protein [Acidimicrobiales bacterium]